MNKRSLLLVTATLIALVFTGHAVAQGTSTFIKAEVQNPSDEWASGYNFVMLTPGKLNSATLDGQKAKAAGIGTQKVNWALSDQPVPPKGKLQFRTAFTPDRYWDVYFVDYFTYKSGASEQSALPYAAFFISFTETANPDELMATLTVVNNIAATYGVASKEIAASHGIPAKLIDDKDRASIHFTNNEVYVNNDLSNYSLQHFDNPTGTRLALPSSFTLAPGEVRNFNLGKVKADSYIFTRSTVSYVGSKAEFPMECAHAPEPNVEPVVASGGQ